MSLSSCIHFEKCVCKHTSTRTHARLPWIWFMCTLWHGYEILYTFFVRSFFHSFARSDFARTHTHTHTDASQNNCTCKSKWKVLCTSGVLFNVCVRVLTNSFLTIISPVFFPLSLGVLCLCSVVVWCGACTYFNVNMFECVCNVNTVTRKSGQIWCPRNESL